MTEVIILVVIIVVVIAVAKAAATAVAIAEVSITNASSSTSICKSIAIYENTWNNEYGSSYHIHLSIRSNGNSNGL